MTSGRGGRAPKRLGGGTEIEIEDGFELGEEGGKSTSLPISSPSRPPAASDRLLAARLSVTTGMLQGGR